MSSKNRKNSNNSELGDDSSIDEDEIVYSGIRVAAWVLLGLVLVSVLMIIFRPNLRHRWHRMFRRHRGSSDTIVEEDELSPYAPRTVMYFADYCGACRVVKPIIEDYAERNAPRGFKLVMKDCANPRNREECLRIAHIPRFCFKRNAMDEGEFFVSPGGFKIELFDEFIRRKLQSCIEDNDDNNNDNNNNDNTTNGNNNNDVFSNPNYTTYNNYSSEIDLENWARSYHNW